MNAVRSFLGISTPGLVLFVVLFIAITAGNRFLYKPPPDPEWAVIVTYALREALGLVWAFVAACLFDRYILRV